MTNVTEIRVGNWFDDIFCRYFQVRPIDIADWEAINCMPIPLTPDILEACRFKKAMPGTIDEAGELYSHPCGLSLYWTGVSAKLPNQFTFTQVQYKYLHQLQNLVFALTGQELEVKLSAIANH